MIVDLTSEPKQVVLRFVKDWLKLLAEGKLADACTLIDSPAPDGPSWTPELITSLIADTYRPGSRFYQLHPEGPVFTDPDLLPEPYQYQCYAYNNEEGYWIDYPIPLNGEWSDLIANFDFYRRGQSSLVVLNNLHIM